MPLARTALTDLDREEATSYLPVPRTSGAFV